MRSGSEKSWWGRNRRRGWNRGRRNGDAGVMARRWDPAWGWYRDGAIWQARWHRWDRWGKGWNGERKRSNWWMGVLRSNGRRSLRGKELISATERGKGWRMRKTAIFFGCQSFRPPVG